MLTLGTDKFHLAKYLGSVFLGSKTAVLVLGVKGGQYNIFGNFVKIFIIAAFWTDNAIGRGGKVVWLHEQG